MIDRNDQLSNKKTQTQPSFYYSLRQYTPICYSGKGVPTFLVLKNRSLSSLPCIVIINILAILIIIFSFLNQRVYKDGEMISLFKNINILVLIFIDISYLFTILLNPGIISQDDLVLQQGENYHFCQRCNYRTSGDMSHCIECGVCVENLDHHCSFFGKCIAGVQRFAFYGFLTFLFIGFIALLGSISLLLNPS